MHQSILTDILTFEANNKSKFLRPFSVYHKATSNKDGSDNIRKLRCLALCHGHNHSNIILSTINGNCFWYMVNINKNSYPDYVCDISDGIDMSIFPNKYFDIIINLGFPLGDKDNKYKYPNILINIRRIIKPQGKIFLVELPHLFYYLLDNDEYLNLIDLVDEIIDPVEFNKIKLELIRKFPEKNYTDNKVYSEIIFGINIKYEEINKIINEKSMDFTLNYLNSFGLELIDIKSKYIIVKRIDIKSKDVVVINVD